MALITVTGLSSQRGGSQAAKQHAAQKAAAQNAKANAQGKKYENRLIAHYGGTVSTPKASVSRPTTTVSSTPTPAASQPTYSAPQQQTYYQESYSSGGGGGGGNDWFQEYLEQLRNAAQEAYNRNQESINNMYNSQVASAGTSYNASKKQLADAYSSQQNKLQSGTEDALRQAYISKMQEQKNLDQNLAAQGISGGLSESSKASLANNYGNSRASIQSALTDNLSDLANTYNGNLADMETNYQNLLQSLASAKAQYELQNSNALANATTAALGDMTSLKAQMDWDKYMYDKESADNDYNTFLSTLANNALDVSNVSTKQGSDGSTIKTTTTNRNYLNSSGNVEDDAQALISAYGSTLTPSRLMTALMNMGYNSSAIASALAALGYA